jgi:hypothetical protein
MLADTNDRTNVELNAKRFRMPRREAITFEVILAAEDNPEYQAALVSESNPNNWGTSRIFFHCGNNPEVQEQIAMSVVEHDGLLFNTTKATFREAQAKLKRMDSVKAKPEDPKDIVDRRLLLWILGSSRKPSCCFLCSTGWTESIFEVDTPERALAKFIIGGPSSFSVPALCRHRDDTFQILYTSRARNSVIAEYIEAIRQHHEMICARALEIAEQKCADYLDAEISAQASREVSATQSQRSPYDPETVYDPHGKIKYDSLMGCNGIDAQNVEDPAEPLVNGDRNLATHNF